MSTVDLPNIREPFIDQRTGQISRAWWIWLQQLMTRIGGSGGQDISAITILLNQARANIGALEMQSAEVPSAVAVGELRTLIDEMQAALSGVNYPHGHWEDPDMHAVASTSQAGFMSATDKATLAAAVPNTRQIISGGGLEGGGDLSADRTLSTINGKSRFLAYQTGAQAIAASTATVITFNTELFDALAEFNPATGVFTAQETGIYMFSGRVHGTQGVATNRILALNINGSQASRMQQFNSSTGDGVIAGDSGLVSMTAGDTATLIYFTGQADTTLPGANLVNFSGWRIR